MPANLLSIGPETWKCIADVEVVTSRLALSTVPESRQATVPATVNVERAPKAIAGGWRHRHSQLVETLLETRCVFSFAEGDGVHDLTNLWIWSQPRDQGVRGSQERCSPLTIALSGRHSWIYGSAGPRAGLRCLHRGVLNLLRRNVVGMVGCAEAQGFDPLLACLTFRYGV